MGPPFAFQLRMQFLRFLNNLILDPGIDDCTRINHQNCKANIKNSSFRNQVNYIRRNTCTRSIAT